MTVWALAETQVRSLNQRGCTSPYYKELSLSQFISYISEVWGSSSLEIWHLCPCADHAPRSWGLLRQKVWPRSTENYQGVLDTKKSDPCLIFQDQLKISWNFNPEDPQKIPWLKLDPNYLHFKLYHQIYSTGLFGVTIQIYKHETASKNIFSLLIWTIWSFPICIEM